MKINNNKKFSVARPYIDRKDKKAVLDVLNSGNLSLGPKHILFENEIAKYTGAKYACSVSNGTCGLHLAVKALGLKEGDEVITTPFSFISSSNCLLYEKVKPVFVDIEEETFNINPEKIEKAVTRKTKAMLIVDIFGQTPDMTKIIRIVKKHNLSLIEDACESLGAMFNGKMAGTFGDIGVYAFYPNKQITTGEGGMIVTNSVKIINLCKSLKNQGRNLESNWLFHERLGYNYRMDEMSAALGLSQMRKIDWLIKKKAQIAGLYSKFLSKSTSIIVPKIGSNRTHSWFVYVVRIINEKRDNVMNQLAKISIQTKPYLPVIHLQPFMKKIYGYKEGDFPVSETVASQTLALPFYVDLTKKDVEYICEKLLKYL